MAAIDATEMQRCLLRVVDRVDATTVVKEKPTVRKACNADLINAASFRRTAQVRGAFPLPSGRSMIFIGLDHQGWAFPLALLQPHYRSKPPAR
jgi:hypothetical protein